MEQLKTHIFSNRLASIYLNMPTSRALTCILVVGSGSRFETPETNGLSRFYTNVCWQGSLYHPTAEKLWEVTDKIGLVVKTIVQPEYTVFYFTSIPELFSTSLNLFLQIIFNPSLSEVNIAKEKQLTIADLNFATVNPEYICLNTLNSLMFANSSMGFNPLGSQKVLQNINPQILTAHKNTYYVSENCLLALVGPEAHFDLKKLEPAIKIIPHGPRQNLPVFDFSQSKIVRDKIQQQGQAAYLSLANLCFGRHAPQKLGQNLLLQILAEGRTNKRLKTLRDKKMVGLIRPWIKTLDDCGLFTLQAYTPGRQEKEALNAILDQLKNISNNTITQAELDTAKAFYFNQLTEKLGSSIELIMFYALSYFFNLEEKYPEEILEKVKNISVNDINKLAAIVCKPEAFSYITLGPGF